LKFTRT